MEWGAGCKLPRSKLYSFVKILTLFFLQTGPYILDLRPLYWLIHHHLFSLLNFCASCSPASLKWPPPKMLPSEFWCSEFLHWLPVRTRIESHTFEVLNDLFVNSRIIRLEPTPVFAWQLARVSFESRQKLSPSCSCLCLSHHIKSLTQFHSISSGRSSLQRLLMMYFSKV